MLTATVELSDSLYQGSRHFFMSSILAFVKQVFPEQLMCCDSCHSYCGFLSPFVCGR